MLRKSEGARRKLSRDMKGDYEFVNVPLGVIIFIGIVIALVVFVQATFAKFSAEMIVSEKELQAIDATYIVKMCLEREGGKTPVVEGAIRKDFLDKNRGRYITEFCSINAHIGARLECLECPADKKTYDFNYRPDDGYMHRIFVTVTDGQKNYIYRLSVRVYDLAFAILPS